MITISVETICAGLGHWEVTASDGADVVRFPVDWEAVQRPVTTEELEQAAMLFLRAKYAGVPLHDMGDLLLNGVTI